jgi:hypothetical protein
MNHAQALVYAADRWTTQELRSLSRSRSCVASRCERLDFQTRLQYAHTCASPNARASAIHHA